jgi:5-methyltetrahydropteroyltriglutamate--homocysteine methyltransferase
VALTVTKDRLLPTTVTGSWPRPSWYTASMRGQRFSDATRIAPYREQFFDAVATVLSDQERAGLDILTNGDYHLDTEVAGQAWLNYPLDRWRGLSAREYLPPTDALYTYPPGTLLNEIFVRSWMWPRVVDKVEAGVPLDFAAIWESAQARTDLPVKFGSISAQTIGDMLSIETDKYGKDKHDLIWEMAGILNAEYRALAARGCKVIQIEEPAIHPVAAADPKSPELDFLVDAFNHEVEGLEDVEIWVHTCWGNPNMQRVYGARTYAPSVEIFMERLKADVWTIEAKDNGQEVLPYLKPYRDKSKMKIALGAVSHRDLIADSPDEVAKEIRSALEVIAPENLVVSTDCGFGREGCTRSIAVYKAAAIAQGANIVRRELGGETTRVRIAESGPTLSQSH